MINNAPHSALRAAVNRAIANGSPVITEQRPKAFNVWVRCETYGTTFSRIVEAVDGSDAVKKYIRDITTRHGLDRHDLTVCFVQPI